MPSVRFRAPEFHRKILCKWPAGGVARANERRASEADRMTTRSLRAKRRSNNRMPGNAGKKAVLGAA